MYLKMIKTGWKLLLWPIFTHKYILVNKKVAACPPFCIHLLYMPSELYPLSKVEADIVFEHGNVNNFLNFVL